MRLKEKISSTRKYCVSDWNNGRGELPKIVLAYIDYYHKRASRYKYAYRSFSIFKYFMLAAIPVIQASPFPEDFSWIVVLCSSMCILSDSVINLFHMKEKWTLYRDTNGKLMSEQRQYLLHVGEYYNLGNEECLQVFVSKIEEVVGCEAKEWRETVLKPEVQQH